MLISQWGSDERGKGRRTMHESLGKCFGKAGSTQTKERVTQHRAEFSED